MAGKIGRDAFLYMAGQGDSFAQCGACRFSSEGRCAVLDIAVEPANSCGLFVPGSGGATVEKSVSRQEAGFVERQVQCQRCRFAEKDATRCGLYAELNRTLPAAFVLDTAIEPHACCNAQMPKAARRGLYDHD